MAMYLLDDEGGKEGDPRLDRRLGNRNRRRVDSLEIILRLSTHGFSVS